MKASTNNPILNDLINNFNTEDSLLKLDNVDRLMMVNALLPDGTPEVKRFASKAAGVKRILGLLAQAEQAQLDLEELEELAPVVVEAAPVVVEKKAPAKKAPRASIADRVLKAAKLNDFREMTACNLMLRGLDDGPVAQRDLEVAFIDVYAVTSKGRAKVVDTVFVRGYISHLIKLGYIQIVEAV